MAGAGAGAVHTVARLLGFGSNVVEWAIPDRLAAVARQAVAATAVRMFVAPGPHGSISPGFQQLEESRCVSEGVWRVGEGFEVSGGTKVETRK